MKNSTKILSLFSAVSLLVVTSSCANLMRGFRSDFDDGEAVAEEDTRGGAYPEGGYLDESENRAPATYGQSDSEADAIPNRPRGSGGTWITNDDMSQGRVAYSNTPSMSPSTKRLYKNGARARKEDFIDDTRSDGSLWTSDGQTNYFLTKNKIRGIGDIVTINTDANFMKDLQNEIKRTLTSRERDIEMELAQERIRRKTLGLPDLEPSGDEKKDAVASNNSSANRGPAAAKDKEGEDKEEPQIPDATFADVDVLKSLDFKAGDPVMAEIVERYPNGNYKLRGVKRMRYRDGYRLVNVVGIAKGSDITEDEQIPAGKLYEYRLQALR